MTPEIGLLAQLNDGIVDTFVSADSACIDCISWPFSKSIEAVDQRMVPALATRARNERKSCNSYGTWNCLGYSKETTSVGVYEN
jgi:hypothetical protein